MSRKLTALLLAMLVLVGAMGLKAAVMAHSNGAVMMANGAAPYPPLSLNGAAPYPPSSLNGAAPYPPLSLNGAAPYPPSRNGAAPYPPTSRNGAAPYPPSVSVSK